MNHPLTLLFGLPRSGTTWFGKIFDSHPDTLYFHEPDSKQKLIFVPDTSDPEDGPLRHQFLTDYVESFPKIKSSHVNGKLPLFDKSYRFDVIKKLHHTNIVASKGVESLIELTLPCYSWLTSKQIRRAHWVWKSIESTRHLGLILSALPNTRSILITRHPCGQIASAIRGEREIPGFAQIEGSEDRGIFEKLAATNEAKEHGLSMDKFSGMHSMERRAWRWALPYEKAINETKDNNRCLLVRYEDVAKNPQYWAKSMLEFAGLEWSSQTEAFIQQSATQQNDDFYSVYKDSKITSMRWQKELTMGDASMIIDTVAKTIPGQLYV